jgi:hypothetical protein
MKTSVNMNRQMGKFIVKQRTKDGYFDASYLMQQWNDEYPLNKKQLSKFLENETTKKFINEIIEQESHTENSLHGDFQVIIKIKGKNTKYGKNHDKVFMHPYLYLDFAMWLSSIFKYHVIKFVYDELIEYRHAAGLGNNELMDAISRTWKISFPPIYREINTALNYIIFDKNYTGIRNSASIKELKDLRDMQKIFAYNILTGLIPDIKTLKIQLKKEYVRRHMPNHKSIKHEN